MFIARSCSIWSGTLGKDRQGFELLLGLLLLRRTLPVLPGGAPTRAPVGEDQFCETSWR